ncbi:hypothetical protein EJD97_009055, partial [Solanum chilense]
FLVLYGNTLFSKDVAVGLLIDVVRRIYAADRFVKKGLWPIQDHHFPLGSKVGSRKVGIFGLGSKGPNVARRLEAFERTRHIIHKEILLALGKRGVVINISREPKMELVKCLEEGEIAGAGLNAFDNEPNVPKLLLSMDNVVLTKHVWFLY